MTNVLIIDGVYKRWRGAQRLALDNLSLHIPAGSAFGLLGPNGSGKSTLIGILLGLYSRDAGRISVAGHDLDGDLKAVRAACGLAPQSPGYYPTLTVKENLELFGRARGLRHSALRDAVNHAMEQTNIGSRADERAQTLSGGYVQRLNLALALLGQPPVLVLDEPTAGVDLQSRQLILGVLKRERERGTTLLYASHELDEVEELCDRAAIISQGQCRAAGLIEDLSSAKPQLDMVLKQPPDAVQRARLEEAGASFSGSERRFTLDTDDPTRVVSLVDSLKLEISSMQFARARLAQVYFELTGTGI